MITNDQVFDSATMYIWEKKTPVDLNFIQHCLHKTRAPSVSEMSDMYGKMFTDPYSVYHRTKEKAGSFHSLPQDEFSTPMLEERLKAFGLELPNKELRFLPRAHNQYEPFNPDKIIELAVVLADTTASDILVVGGTDIENGYLFSTPVISEKLRIQPAPLNVA